MVHNRVRCVPLQIVFGYRGVLRPCIRESSRRFAGACHLVLESTLPGLYCQIRLRGQYGKFADIFVLACELLQEML